MNPSDAEAPAPSLTPWAYAWRAALRALLLCGAIGLFLTGLEGGRDLAENLLYSTCIGMTCFTLIDGGRALLARRVWRDAAAGASAERRSWPGWPAMLAVIVFGAVGGYVIGAAIANGFTGGRLPMPWNLPWRASTGMLTISLTAAVVSTYVFWLRSRSQSDRAQAEAAQRLAAQTQLRLLQSQLEPHMLFNTLANLRALIALDPPRAQEMLDRLIAFLRATLQASRAETQPLSAEFARIADYLALMQVRMGARLQTRLDLPEALAALPLPPLLLQPLVENAIRHGLEPQRAGGWLELSAAREGDRLLLRVRDTGVGLGATLRADAHPDDASSTAGTGFGLAQVHERLARLYGSGATLDLSAVDPADGGGTLATISLPLPT